MLHTLENIQYTAYIRKYIKYCAHKKIYNILHAFEKHGKYNDWHSIDGKDLNGNICVKGRVEAYLRKR